MPFPEDDPPPRSVPPHANGVPAHHKPPPEDPFSGPLGPPLAVPFSGYLYALIVPLAVGSVGGDAEPESAVVRQGLKRVRRAVSKGAKALRLKCDPHFPPLIYVFSASPLPERLLNWLVAKRFVVEAPGFTVAQLVSPTPEALRDRLATLLQRSAPARHAADAAESDLRADAYNHPPVGASKRKLQKMLKRLYAGAEERKAAPSPHEIPSAED